VLITLDVPKDALAPSPEREHSRGRLSTDDELVTTRELSVSVVADVEPAPDAEPTAPVFG
jgi:hypothetical protein